MRKILFFMLGYFMLGCGAVFKSKYESYPEYEDQQYYQQEAYYEGEYLEDKPAQEAMASNLSRNDKYGKRSSYDKYKNAELMSKSETKKQEQAQTVARMVHYNGYANLHVARPEEIVEEIVSLSKKYKGDIERRSTRSITIRIPKASFSNAFNDIIALGDVLSKSITSEDVTEAFTSVELRLKTAQTTRDRLRRNLEPPDGRRPLP